MTDQSVTKAKRQRRPDDRPAEILAAALSVFAEKGFSQARMEDVAARAGLSKGALYLYFPDKVALLKALVQQAIGGQISLAAEMLAQLNGPVSPLVIHLAQILASRVQDTPFPYILKLVIAESQAHPEIGRFYLENVIRQAMPIIEALLARGIAAGEFREVNVPHAVKSLMGPFLLSALWRSVFEPLGAEAVDVRGLITQHVDIFLKGLRP
ncbi:MAG: TetR/AcrR family transcriptional regulator [Rhizobiales bacterium]|nr:TetR/AcrR family transcriptional regulator [Hyphomicrobiales bacterium]